LRGRYGDKLFVRLTFDGAQVSYDNSTDPIGRFATGMRDAYLRYTVTPQVQLYAGRFKPPFDLEELTPTEFQFFVQRSLESRGVKREEGFAGDNPGFAAGRQIGVMVAGDDVVDVGFSKLGYAVAVTNGNGHDARLNDNDLLATWGRVFLSWNDEHDKTDEEGPASNGIAHGGRVGLSAFYNEPSTGILPNRSRDRVMGGGVDFALSKSWFYFNGQLLAMRSSHLNLSRAPAEVAYGGHIQLSLITPYTRLYPGYRFAIYDPRTVMGSSPLVRGDDIDRIMHHSVGLRYQLEDLPLLLLADYTHSVEQLSLSIPNDRLQASVQVNY
jgi:hypothetical protein